MNDYDVAGHKFDSQSESGDRKRNLQESDKGISRNRRTSPGKLAQEDIVMKKSMVQCELGLYQEVFSSILIKTSIH